jgi:BolA family transcriptional regulator, general stress-responsive regulator
MSIKDRITAKLASAFSPASLDVIDDSAKHAGHIGHPGSGHPGQMSSTETHFTVKVVSAAFGGKSRLERHRMVNALLADEFRDGVHALAIEAKAPGE